MKPENTANRPEEPVETYGQYTYADYLTWKFDNMVEIIRGKLFKMTAAPGRIHQKIAAHLTAEFYQFLRGHPCHVYPAPFDVRLPLGAEKNEDIYTVVQPDLSIVCDLNKLDDAGCKGPPDLIVEILSPGNNRKDVFLKFKIYEESGVLEYWVIHPHEQTLVINRLVEGVFLPSRFYTAGDIVESQILPGFKLDLSLLFEDTV